MKYTHETKKLPKGEVEITVTITKEELKPFLDKAVANISDKIEVKGFRKGKVPYEILKKEIGEMKIYEEAGLLAAEKSYIEIATAEKLEPLGSPKIDFVKLAPNNDFTYKATVSLIPEIKLGDYKSIKAKEKGIDVNDDEIDKVLNEAQESRAKEVLEDKAIENGDKVEIDMDIFRDNVPIEDGAQKKYPLIIGSNHFIPGFEKNLIGLKAKDTKEFEVTFPEKYHNSNLAGKPAKFKIKVLSVFKRELPKIDDEFAKTLGQDSLNKLKEQIKHNIEHEQHHKEEERVEIELLEKIINISEFNKMPDSLIDAESNKMMQEIESNISRQGLKFDDYLKHLNKTAEQLRLEFAPQALKRVKGALITREIFFKEKIEVTDEDIDKEIEQATQMYANNPELQKNLKSPQYREYLKNMIGNKKVMDYLKITCVERNDKNSEHKCEH